MIDSANGQPTRVRYVVLAWCCSLSMLTYIDRVCIKQVSQQMQFDLGITRQQMGWVFSAFSLSYALFEMPSGWLGDRLGPRNVLARIVVWWSLFTALTGCVFPFEVDSGYGIPLPFSGSTIPLALNGFVALLVIRFLFGVGEAGAFPNIARALRSWFPYESRGRAQGLLWTFARWGGALAPPLIAACSSLYGWRGAFITFGVAGIVWVVFFHRWFRDSPSEHPAANEAERQLVEGPGAPQGPRTALSWAHMLRSPTLWMLGLMYFCSNAGWCFFITWDVRYYSQVLHLTDSALLFASGAPLFFGGIACLLGGFLTDRQVRIWGPRWGRTLQGACAYLLGALFFAVPVFWPDPWIAVPSLCLASFAKDFAMAVSWSTCLDIGHRYSGTVSGFMNMVGNLGQVGMPPLVAALAGENDWHVALVVSSCMFSVSAVAWLFINPRRVIVYAPADLERLRAAGASAV